MLKTKIKASQIQHLTDARYFSAWYAESLGFNLEPQTLTAVTPQQLQEIRVWLAGVDIVGECGFSQSGTEILALAEQLELDAVQLPHFYDKTEALKIAQSDCPIIKYLQFTTDWATTLQDAANYADIASIFVLDLSNSNLAKMAAWTAEDKAQLDAFTKAYTTYLAFDVLPEDIDELLALLPNMEGIQLKGGEEERVGVKSFDELDALFDVLQD